MNNEIEIRMKYCPDEGCYNHAPVQTLDNGATVREADLPPEWIHCPKCGKVLAANEPAHAEVYAACPSCGHADEGDGDHHFCPYCGTAWGVERREPDAG